MKELALARGFYPIVAIGPDYDSGRSHKGAGKGSSKGKGTSSKGKGSKGKGKGKPSFQDGLCMVFESLLPRPLPDLLKVALPCQVQLLSMVQDSNDIVCNPKV